MRATSRTFGCPDPLDVPLTFGALVHGRHDPSSRIVGTSWWRAMNSPEGPVTVLVCADPGAAAVHVRAWGPGGAWAMEHAAGIVGLDDRPRDFTPAGGIVASLHRRLGGLRVVRLGTALDLAVATIIEQRVTTVEALRSWRMLVRRHGAPAPGGHDLVVPPPAGVLAALADREWRRIEVEERRSSAARRIALDAAGIERAVAAGTGPLERRLLGIRGVGVWTAAHVTHFASGDADAVPVGDWHLPRHVGNALAGEPRADDERMLELLEPFRPHRGRVWRLVVAGTRPPPRRAPKARIHRLMRAEANRGRY